MPAVALATNCCQFIDSYKSPPSPYLNQSYAVNVADSAACDRQAQMRPQNIDPNFIGTTHTYFANEQASGVGGNQTCAADDNSAVGGAAAITGAGDVANQTAPAKPTPQTAGTVPLPNPLPNIDSIPKLIGRIINGIMGIIGAICLVMFIIGGTTWLTAMGNDKTVAKGKAILVWAVVGMVVIFSAYVVVNFVIQTLQA